VFASSRIVIALVCVAASSAMAGCPVSMHLQANKLQRGDYVSKRECHWRNHKLACINVVYTREEAARLGRRR
jgi:hypothetical protein